MVQYVIVGGSLFKFEPKHDSALFRGKITPDSMGIDWKWFIDEDGVIIDEGGEQHDVRRGDIVLKMYSRDSQKRKLFIIPALEVYEHYLDYKTKSELDMDSVCKPQTNELCEASI